MKFFRVITSKSIFNNKSNLNPLFYNNNKFTFARAIGKKSLNIPKTEDIIEPKLKQDIQSTEQTISNYDEFNVSSINNMITSLYKKSKFYFLDSNKEPFENLERHYKYYKFITENLKHVKADSFESLIKSLCFFEYKDNSTVDILTHYYNLSTDKFKAACNIIHSINKLKIKNINLQKSALKIIETAEFKLEDKDIIIPFINNLTDLGLNNEKITTKINEFIINNSTSLSDLELTVLFRYYAINHLYNFSVLQYLEVRASELINDFSARSLLLLCKCLADLNMINTELINKIKKRIDMLIAQSKKDKEEVLSCENMAYILNYLIRLESLDMNEYIKFEKEFFELANINGLNNEAIIMIFSSHCKLIRGLVMQVFENSNEDKLPFKVKKQYMEINVDFMENLKPYLERHFDEFDFKTWSQIFILIKSLDITQRKFIDNLMPIYLTVINKYIDQNLKTFLEIGIELVKTKENRERIRDVLKESGKEYNINFKI